MAPPRRLAAVLAQLGEPAPPAGATARRRWDRRSAPSDRRCAPSLRGSSGGSSGGSVAPAEPDCPVSADDVAFFRANGYLLVKSLVPPSELVDVDRDSMALIERGEHGPFGDARWNYGDDPDDASPIPRRINGLADDDMPPSFQLLLAYPPLLATAAALMADANGESRAFAAGVPGALVYKVPHRGFPVPWHQDPVVIRRYPAFNVDVYLDDSDEDNACVYALPGSHLGGYFPTPEHVEAWTGGLEGPDVPGAVPVVAAPGGKYSHSLCVFSRSLKDAAAQTCSCTRRPCSMARDGTAPTASAARSITTSIRGRT